MAVFAFFFFCSVDAVAVDADAAGESARSFKLDRKPEGVSMGTHNTAKLMVIWIHRSATAHTSLYAPLGG